MAVPNIFATATSSIPLSQLDTNFATAITLGSTALYLGNTTTSVAGLTLTGSAFNGTIGATTPSTGAFTTLSASDNVTATKKLVFTSTTSSGSESRSIHSTANILIFQGGTGGYSFNSSDDSKSQFAIADAAVNNAMVLSATGLAVTGTLTSTLDATLHGLTVGLGGGSFSAMTVVGYQAQNAVNTVGYATMVGYQAGYANTANNEAFGYRALYTNNTGSNNVAIGHSSLLLNTSGQFNIAIGRDSLQANTTASNNTAVGYQAGYSNTTGTRNTAVGWGSFYTNTTGSSNTAVGGYALRFSTTADSNTGIGDAALYANTTGAKNTALGTSALESNTTASYNTAVGYQAGYSATTQTGNTFFGYQAGYTHNTGGTIGSYNCFIGLQAGYLVTTGIKNTILGGYNGNSGGLDIRTASNYIVLSDGDGNPRGIFDNNGIFCINQTATGLQNSNSFALSPVSAAMFYSHASGVGSGTVYAQFGYNASAIGSITQSGTTAVLYNVTSDQRLKENIIDAPEFGSVIDSVKVRSFDWKSDNSHQRAGFIAQELLTVAPEAVHQPSNTDEMMAVDYSKLVPMLVKEIQSLRQRVAQLESN